MKFDGRGRSQRHSRAEFIPVAGLREVQCTRRRFRCVYIAAWEYLHPSSDIYSYMGTETYGNIASARARSESDGNRLLRLKKV